MTAPRAYQHTRRDHIKSPRKCLVISGLLSLLESPVYLKLANAVFRLVPRLFHNEEFCVVAKIGGK